jgi:TonB family protein
MSRPYLFIFVALASGVIAQSLPETKVTVGRLSPPIYPRLALQARIAGNVELDVAVRPDGSVESIALVSGHPMLKTAAIESAHKTEFECKDCRDPSTLYHMTYKFESGDAVYCKRFDSNGYGIYDASAATEVSQSQSTITVRGRPYETCDPTERISVVKFRAAKCLYLWRCGKRPLQ